MKNLILSLLFKKKKSTNYLTNALNKVSRSFAVVIPLLEKPLDEYISVAYLICRVADNIEDCTEPSEWKNDRFNELKGLIQGEYSSKSLLSQWSAYKWKGLTADEYDLMTYKGGAPLWKLFHDFPIEVKAILTRWIFEMIEGMMRVINKSGQPDFTKYEHFEVLSSEFDYNKYCYYVAGTVGHLATDLIAMQYSLTPEVLTALKETSESSGLALQKTNIIKDFKEDIENGICFIPMTWHVDIDKQALMLQGAPAEWKVRVLKDALEELEQAMRYVSNVPLQLKGYRAACLMSFLPAYETIFYALKNLDTLFTKDHYVKISKITFMQCHQQAQKFAKSNEALSSHIESLKERFLKYNVDIANTVLVNYVSS